MAEQSSRIGPWTILGRFQREGAPKRRPITEELSFCCLVERLEVFVAGDSDFEAVYVESR